MRYDRHDVALNARLHALICEQGDAARGTLTHGQQYLTALARAGDGRGLVEPLAQAARARPRLRCRKTATWCSLALAAVQQRDFALATALLRGFDKRFPRHADTPGVIFLGASCSASRAASTTRRRSCCARCCTTTRTRGGGRGARLSAGAGADAGQACRGGLTRGSTSFSFGRGAGARAPHARPSARPSGGADGGPICAERARSVRPRLASHLAH